MAAESIHGIRVWGTTRPQKERDIGFYIWFYVSTLGGEISPYTHLQSPSLAQDFP